MLPLFISCELLLSNLSVATAVLGNQDLLRYDMSISYCDTVLTLFARRNV
jgi:hypothetical protein